MKLHQLLLCAAISLGLGGTATAQVAYGAQDVYLTGKPQITHFKKVYRRHTDFNRDKSVQPKSTAKQTPTNPRRNMSGQGGLSYSN